MVSLNSNDENRPEDSMNSISDSFEKISHEEIKKQLLALESLLSKVKTPLCKSALEQLKSFLGGEDTTDYSHLNEIYKYLIQSLDKEPELDRSLVCKALGLDAELDNAPDLENLIKEQIAGFNKGELLEMLYSSQISYGDGESKLEKDGFKTRKQFKDEGYQIIKFYENELIQDEYCPDSGYKLEKRDVDYALKADNSCTRDAGCIFIGKNGEVTIAYHGTRDNKDDMCDLNALLTEVQFSDKKVGSIHRGFYSLFKRSWPNVHKILQGHANNKELKGGIKDLKINVTGHSMGGALATIAALCLKETESVKDVHVATFGSPRALYQDSAGAYSKCLGEKTIRVASQSDPVPCLPPGGGGQYYKHVGKPLKLETGSRFNPSDHRLSKYLEFIGDIKQEIFKSDDNVSKYFQLARLFGVVCSNFPKDIPFSNDKEFFEKVKEENRGIKLSEIPLYILKSEKELKQAEQERDELNGKVAQLTQGLEEFKNTKAQLERERDSVKQELVEKISEVTTLTKELEETKVQLAESKQDLADKTKKLKNTEGQLKQVEQEKSEQQTRIGKVAQLTEELKGMKDQLTEKGKEISGLNDQVIKLQNDKEELESTQTQLEKLQKDSDAKTKEFEDTKAQLKRELDSVKQELDKTTEELKRKEADVENGKKKLDNVNEKVLQLQEKLKQEQQKTNQLNDQVDELEGTKVQLADLQKKLDDAKQLEEQLNSIQQDLNKKTSKVATLTKELEETKVQLAESKQDLADKTKKLKNTEGQLKQVEQEKSEQQTRIGKVAQLTEELKGMKDQLTEKGKEISGLNDQVIKLQNDKEQTLANAKSQFAEKDETIRSLGAQLTGKDEALNSKTREITDLNDTIGKLKKINTELKEKTSQVEEVLNGMQQSLKGPNLGNENKKLSAVSAQSRKQVIYASVSFVLSGAFAVGISLTMFHLAICITLAVAALTSLAVGCYCSYKANTALSNVEIDKTNGTNLAAA